MTTSPMLDRAGNTPIRTSGPVRQGKRAENLVIYLILGVLVITTIFPFLWMLTTSFKTDEKIFVMPPQWIPDPLTTEHYVNVFELQPMANALWNSVKISTIATFGTLFTSSLAAYSFAKIRFRYKNVIFLGFLATIMIPGQVTLIPLYIVFSKMGWIDSHLPLIVPGVLINAYGVFLLRQFMRTIPDAYVEAAKLDGANHLQIYWRVALPLCKPALITLGLFTFLGNWNNFLGPLIFLNSEDRFTIPLIINSFRTAYGVEWGLLMAAACIALIPPLILYVVAQRYFVQGITLSGLK